MAQLETKLSFAHTQTKGHRTEEERSDDEEEELAWHTDDEGDSPVSIC